MNPQQAELVTAKTVIANQQIHIQRLLEQAQSMYAFTPDRELVHVACGEPGLEEISDPAGWKRICSCFSDAK